MNRSVTAIIGLPCSGKSTYAKTFSEHLIIDDPKNFSEIKSFLNSKDNLLIIDCFLCIKENQEKFVKIFPYSNFIFFENNPTQCLLNFEKRKENGDLRDVKNSILMLSKLYFIPENIKTLPVYKYIK